MKMKIKVKVWLPIVLILAFIGALALFHADIINLISSRQQKKLTKQQIEQVEKTIDSRFNYYNTTKKHSYTLLQFGSTKTVNDQGMGKVIEAIKKQFHDKVNVVFIDVSNPENELLVKYYGVATIPCQILLDRSGNKYHTNIGYISASELAPYFD